jgi:hypothetical protein
MALLLICKEHAESILVPCTENVRQDCSTQWVHFRFMAVKLAKYMKLLLHNSLDNSRDADKLRAITEDDKIFENLSAELSITGNEH